MSDMKNAPAICVLQISCVFSLLKFESRHSLLRALLGSAAAVDLSHMTAL